MMPDIDGFKLCNKIREKYNFPIIFVTAKVENIDKITGLSIGADDYITKPFQPLELIARVKAQLRRYKKYNNQDNTINTNEIDFRGIRINNSTHEFFFNEKLVELAWENARMVLEKDRERIRREEGRTIGAVHEVEDWLGLKGLNRMEAFDISNISGFESVGSMVVYEKGKPKRSDYRKFRIKSVQGPNDYASMEEVLTRRFTHESNGEFDSFSRMPDLLLMDGGRGQVNIALGVLDKLGIRIPVCGMVKDDHHRTRGLYFDNIEIPIDTNSEGFRLITRIQDEAHRFAIEYHRSLRSKEQVHSVLDDIPGIGERRRKALMRRYRSIEGIRDATVEELAETESMNIGSAKQVYEFFHPNK